MTIVGTTVWLAEHCFFYESTYEGSDLLGVFASRESALEACEAHRAETHPESAFAKDSGKESVTLSVLVPTQPELLDDVYSYTVCGISVEA